MQDQDLLRNALKINGVFSIISALTAILFAGSSLAVYEMAGGNGYIFGIQLLLFAAFVLFNAFRKGLSKVMIIVIIVLDILYVFQSLALLVMNWSMLSIGGIVLIGVTTIAVGALALSQFFGLRRALKS